MDLASSSAKPLMLVPHYISCVAIGVVGRLIDSLTNNYICSQTRLCSSRSARETVAAEEAAATTAQLNRPKGNRL